MDATSNSDRLRDRKGSMHNNAYLQLQDMIKYYDELEVLLEGDLNKLKQNKNRNKN